MLMPDFSLIIIVSERREQLRNVLEQLHKSSVKPSEVLVIYMDDLPEILETGIALRNFRITGTSGKMPLAAARNFGAKYASFEKLFFLDVDCLPAPDFFERMLEDYSENSILSGTPYYLPADFDMDALEEQAVAHPAKPPISDRQPVADYNSFWSLCFLIGKEQFRSLGGFEEAYTGYGAEDTDFAQKLRKAEIPFFRSPAKVYHQYHPKYEPPLNHLEAICQNAEIFHQRWGFFPMEIWLKEFQKMGYITMKENKISILKFPSSEEIADCLTKKPY